MSAKVIQLDLFGKEESEDVLLRKSLKALFACDHAKTKLIKQMMCRVCELEEIVYRMNDRINRAME